MNKFSILPNPNKSEYDEITACVVANDGYCPCMSVKNSDTKCICKVFREQKNEGLCHCGRYIKTKL